MKFLCLHGAFGSAKNFQVQLGPFVQKTESECDVKYKWISGLHAVDPPPGFDDYFGEKPVYRFIPFDGIDAFQDVLFKLNEFPEGRTAEDTMRCLVEAQYGSAYTKRGVKEAIDAILKVIDEDPEIEGILGYSEGATTAATLVLEERRRWEEEGIPRRIKCAMFFAGWPPLSLKGDDVSVLLADECDDVIDIPTCHIVGCNDPYIDGAMALFSMCSEDTAELFDHGKGHTVPRDARTLGELAAAVSRVVSKVEPGRRDSSTTDSDSDVFTPITPMSDCFSFSRKSSTSETSMDFPDEGDKLS